MAARAKKSCQSESRSVKVRSRPAMAAASNSGATAPAAGGPPLACAGGEAERDRLPRLIAASQPDVPGPGKEPAHQWARGQAAQAVNGGHVLRQLGELIVVQFDTRDAVARGALRTGQPQVRRITQVGRVVHAPPGAMLLLFEETEPF